MNVRSRAIASGVSEVTNEEADGKLQDEKTQQTKEGNINNRKKVE
jgi:hypothetical protein